MREPLVTVVVVNWNGAALLRRCLDSLATQTVAEQIRVVVVDNASTDSSLEVLAGYPWVEVMRSQRNVGFAGGNDLALTECRTPFAFLLNNDAYADTDAVEQLLAAAGRPAAADVAAMAATVLLDGRFRPDPDGEVVSAAGRWAADPSGPVELVNSTGNCLRTDGFGVDRGWLEPRGEHHPEREVFGFSGAAVLLRMSALAEVGLFERDFFMYYEDTDLSWRLRSAGWRVEHCADAVVRHQHSATAVEGSPFAHFHNDRNRLLTLTRNASLPLLARTVLRYPLSAASMARAEWPDVSRTRLRLRVLASYLRLLPGTLARRHRITRSATVPRREVERLLVAPAAQVGAYRSRSA